MSEFEGTLGEALRALGKPPIGAAFGSRECPHRKIGECSATISNFEVCSIKEHALMIWEVSQTSFHRKKIVNIDCSYMPIVPEHI